MRDVDGPRDTRCESTALGLHGRSPGVIADGIGRQVRVLSEHMDRRTFVKGAAWSVPVVAVAVAVPLAAASTVPEVPARFPVSCELINGTGSPFYAVVYSDASTATLHRSEVVKDEALKALCVVPANGNEGQ